MTRPGMPWRLAAVAALAATCAAGLVESAGAASGFPLRIHDALRRTVVLPAPPRRIVSLAPSVTETLFALGLDAEIVGVSAADDYPVAARGRSRVGGVELDYERIAALRPDLVVGVASLQRSSLQRLVGLGLPVLAVDVAGVDDVLGVIRVLGKVTGREGAAASLVAGLRRRIEEVTRITARAATRPRVYVEIWPEPLMTASVGTYLHDLIERAGGRNVFGDLRGWPQVGAETVIRRNPEVILISGGGSVVGLRARRGWQAVAAVRAGRIHVVQGALIARPGPRLVDGLEAVARILHPTLFSQHYLPAVATGALAGGATIQAGR
ncbi:MAG: cobalamin-binding protein [Armatimonadetes bacterium]|nr:cobalamin-binding protein [Armatimonadota bacterium]